MGQTDDTQTTDTNDTVTNPVITTDDKPETFIDEAMTPPKEAVNVSYDDLKFQDGMTTEEIQAQKDLFKSLGLSSEAATKWIEDKTNATITAAQRAIEEHTAKLKSEWSALQEKNLQEIKKQFGDKLQEEQKNVITAIDTFLPKEDAESFKKFQRETGLGNNPLFIKFMAGIGSKVSDGKINLGSDINNGETRLYPNSNMNLG